jgi:hypothetical protein
MRRWKPDRVDYLVGAVVLAFVVLLPLALALLLSD